MQSNAFTEFDFNNFMSEQLYDSSSFQTKLQEMISKYPDQKTVNIEWGQINLLHDELAHFVLEYPEIALRHINNYLREHVVIDGDNVCDIEARILFLPDDYRISIRKLRHVNIQKMIAIAGIVSMASVIRPKLQVLAQQCRTCGAIHLTPQSEETLTELKVCEAPSGCGRSGTLMRRDIDCVYVDTQDIEIQESPDALHGGNQPEVMKCIVEGELTKDNVRIHPGDRVIINGILKTKPAKRNSLTFLMELDVLSVEFMQHGFEDMEFTDDDIQRILEASKNPNLIIDFAKAIAASILGYNKEKQSFILQQFGGQSIDLDDGTRTRGEIHIFLLGDPGVAKTVMLRGVTSVAPRVVFAQGGGSSRVGLTATAERDETTGKWSLKAGAVVLANEGTMVFDEIDKVPKDDIAAMHEAMESGTVTVCKAGIVATLNARCNVLGAANPKYGRFVPEEAFAGQTLLPPSLLSRFDLIFVMRDLADKDKDSKIVKHIGKRRSGVVAKTPYDAEFIKKYIAFARAHAKRIDHSEEAIEMISDYYVKLRQMGGDGNMAITARQIEGIYRLSEANAKAHMKSTATVADAEIAIDLTDYCLKQLIVDENGQYDSDRLFNVIPGSVRNKVELVKKYLASKNNDGGANIVEITEALSATISEQDVLKALQTLNGNSEFTVNNGKYKLVM